MREQSLKQAQQDYESAKANMIEAMRKSLKPFINLKTAISKRIAIHKAEIFKGFWSRHE